MAIGRLFRIAQFRRNGLVEMIVHTDGSLDDIKEWFGPHLSDVSLQGKNDTNVLQLISDLVHCDTMVGTPGSLSHLGSYLTKAAKIFAGGKPNFKLMNPRTQDLHHYIRVLCTDHWKYCDGKEKFDSEDVRWLLTQMLKLEEEK